MMSGTVLMIPFFLIRFGLLAVLDTTAIQRAAHFALFNPNEKVVYWTYRLSNVAIFVSPFCLKIKTAPTMLFCVGLIIYALGTELLAVSIVSFVKTSENGMNRAGLYRLSRNPMYVSYFISFLGCALLTQSPWLFCFVIVFQISAHWIILSEERWIHHRSSEMHTVHTWI
ncbi:MAG: methyltransferase [Sphaerochaetaceae bacterium]|nr:methyltransferase [Sphaerochaetaceae bacterium]